MARLRVAKRSQTFGEMKSSPISHFIFATIGGLAALLLGCDGSDAGPVDAATEPDAPMRCESAPPAIEAGDPDGHAEPLAVSAGQARAGRIEASELPVDHTGLATWAAGDFVLANERVAVIVEDAGDSDLFDPWGGKPVGIGRLEGGRIVDAGDFEELIPALGLFTLHTERVSVLADGSAGGPAIVRAEGELERIPFLAEFAGPVVRGDFTGVRAAFDWSLAPGDAHVTLSITVVNERANELGVLAPLHVVMQASRMAPWLESGSGFDTDGASGIERILFDDPLASSYAWQSADGALEPVIEAGGAGLYTARRFAYPPCSTSAHDFARLTIGGPGLDGLRRTLDPTLRAVDVMVLDAGGAPAAGVRVHATRTSGEHVTRALTDETGHATLSLPAEAQELRAVRNGHFVSAPVPVAASDTSAEITLVREGMIHVAITELESGQRVPARVQIIPDAALEAAPASHGERVEQGGRLAIAFATSGDASFVVPAGRHRVVVSRGYEHELDDRMIDVTAGETSELSAVLSRVVDTTGSLSADFHIHTARSPDAPDDGALKVASAVADGLEIPLRSEHEFVADFEDEIDSLGVAAFAYGPGSLELTTYAWGHFGVFPLDPDPARPNGGAFVWAGRTPRDVFDDVRAVRGSEGEAALIINHPRNGGPAGNAFAYFDAAGLDRATLTASRPELWDDGFSVIEVFNDSGWDANEDESVADWLAFLRAGRRMFAVGSSDSHGVLGSPVGYPRTLVALETDDPDALRARGAGPLRDAVLAGHMTISGGITVDARVGEARPGDTASGVGPRASVHVRVQAPSWVDVDRLRVLVDGEPALDTPIAASDAVVRFEGDVEVDVAADPGSFVIVIATGDETLEPVHPGRLPFAVTNPIFLER